MNGLFRCVNPAQPMAKEIDASQAEHLGRSCLSIVPRSRSHARLRRNATVSHGFSCVQPAFVDLYMGRSRWKLRRKILEWRQRLERPCVWWYLTKWADVLVKSSKKKKSSRVATTN
ncbi:hypothetical protein EVAR_50436_1 [Eumeta japonica]|uniref:Uncharacterized protein n=1 Tax=Eumeta variegata TaxID=151549 RepID=A0A4C1XRU9_EUMVA|nr:hypothetical protein EVAR_50436_1 [Eumeta japonica]